MSICYHQAMAEQVCDQKRYDTNGKTYLHPEEYKWLKSNPHIACEGSNCLHWPRFTVVSGSPLPPFYPAPESYMWFRSDPKSVGGKMKLRFGESNWDYAHHDDPRIEWITGKEEQ